MRSLAFFYVAKVLLISTYFFNKAVGHSVGELGTEESDRRRRDRSQVRQIFEQRAPILRLIKHLKRDSIYPQQLSHGRHRGSNVRVDLLFLK